MPNDISNTLVFLDKPNEWVKCEDIKCEDIVSVIRVNKGNEIEGLRNICVKITEHTMHPCSDFMMQ